MQRLTFSGLKINITTNEGVFGQCIKFEKGLNIIRAENTSGKTTIISSIIYALGCESILSAKQGNAVLKSVLRESINYNSKTYNVLESNILLELTNAKGEYITIKRSVIGSKQTNLVSVYFGKLITDNCTDIKKEDFFLNLEGSAQRQKGFHKFLELFIDIELPYVTRYNEDKTVPLYIQTILPLMFIEQVRGWSGIQSTIPKFYGIEGVNNLSFEYVLKLDVMNNRILRKKIKKEIEKNKLEWKDIDTSIHNIANEIKCIVSDFPNITIDLKKEDYPNYIFKVDNKTFILKDYIYLLREEYSKMNILTSQRTDNKEVQSKVDTLQNDIIILTNKLKSNTIELLNEKNDLKKYRLQILDLSSNIKQHKDIKTLIRLGSDEKLYSAEHKCPTCKTNLNDSLQQEVFEPMNLEDNINYLKAQLDAIDILINSSSKKIIKLNVLEEELKNLISEKRNILNSYNKDLFKNTNISEGMVREKINLEILISKLEKVIVSYDDSIEKLLEISSLYKTNSEDLANLPKTDFTDNDTEKINKFNYMFSDLLQSYGYSSTNKIYEIQISTKNYQPFIDGFDLTLESSASDNIRIIWAYSVAMLYMTNFYDTNHFGFVIFDEPEQQRMKKASSKELYKSLTNIKIKNMQSIIATSEDYDSLKLKVKDIQCNILKLDNKSIVPKDNWLFNI